MGVKSAPVIEHQTAPPLADLAASRPGHGLRPHWHLDANCHFLNHGSFGATPRHVLAAQDAWRVQMERQPVQFMMEELPLALRTARTRLASFLGGCAEQLGFVENASNGINAVLRSIAWRAGDEIVLADHAYAAVRNTVAFLAQRFGVNVRLAKIPFPCPSSDALAHAYVDAITPRTRLAIIDHVFSPLALVTPIEALAAHCQRVGVAVLIDGAHGPGMLPLNLNALCTLGVDWYVGNCHKWLCAPKGVGFVYAAPHRVTDLHPTTISNFFQQGFPQEFDWQGTRDYSGWLAVTAALDFLEAFGVARYQAHLHSQAQLAAKHLCARLQIAQPAPTECFAGMVTLPWPWQEEATPERAQYWHDRLWHQHRVEVPVLLIGHRLWLRISAQIYNELADFEALGTALANH